MIKLDVTSERHDDNLITKNTGRVAGDRDTLACEMASVLEEFYSVDDGVTLQIAIEMHMENIMENIIDDLRKS